ncbi:Hypothetical predicted protein, partial [Marmota monax]
RDHQDILMQRGYPEMQQQDKGHQHSQQEDPRLLQTHRHPTLDFHLGSPDRGSCGGEPAGTWAQALAGVPKWVQPRATKPGASPTAVLSAVVAAVVVVAVGSRRGSAGAAAAAVGAASPGDLQGSAAVSPSEHPDQGCLLWQQHPERRLPGDLRLAAVELKAAAMVAVVQVGGGDKKPLFLSGSDHRGRVGVASEIAEAVPSEETSGHSSGTVACNSLLIENLLGLIEF